MNCHYCIYPIDDDQPYVPIASTPVDELSAGVMEWEGSFKHGQHMQIAPDRWSTDPVTKAFVAADGVRAEIGQWLVISSKGHLSVVDDEDAARTASDEMMKAMFDEEYKHAHLACAIANVNTVEGRPDKSGKWCSYYHQPTNKWCMLEPHVSEIHHVLEEEDDDSQKHSPVGSPHISE